MELISKTAKAIKVRINEGKNEFTLKKTGEQFLVFANEYKVVVTDVDLNDIAEFENESLFDMFEQCAIFFLSNRRTMF